MESRSAVIPSGRRRRQAYSDDFKASVVAACSTPGVSIASVALANGINANLARRWVKEHETTSRSRVTPPATSSPALVPISVQAPESMVPSAPKELRVEIRHHHTVVQVTWPLAEASACAHWLREILR